MNQCFSIAFLIPRFLECFCTEVGVVLAAAARVLSPSTTEEVPVVTSVRLPVRNFC